MGQKNHILMLDCCEYTVENTTKHRIMWCCAQKFKTKCRARVVTYGHMIYLKCTEHNHGPTERFGKRYAKITMTLGD
ncbi:unnamed protein product [Acanthoscelides obtectus]|uniref:FLYWCH-type domain-containing protein n=1 Tax=Acanthoscelides obtectus TaxID=200917 RepID=A0A9P0MIJ4_ACAOB|nr:unnamed protein product [Acanthoscelides obtectus]CAK1676570.1 hypothetical protein AOBTE_LOCUS30826 [Acanthoscelides obtectus]